MTAETIALPNLRKLFIPDPGYVIIDADLARADAQVVAAEADDTELRDLFKSGADVHQENAKVIFGTAHPNEHQRDQAKKGCHGSNYGGSAKTLAAHMNCTVHEAEVFQMRWFGAHPKIKEWHKRVAFQLRTRHYVTTPFGFRRYYFDRLNTEDDVGRVLPQALAYVPQSVVGIVTNKGLLNIEANLPRVELLLQVHDSLVMQVPEPECPTIFPLIQQQMLIPIPYPDPLTIPVGIKASRVSWGDVEKIEKWGRNGETKC